MNEVDKIVVCSRSFSKNETLRSILVNNYKYVKFNDEGSSLEGDNLSIFLEGQNKAIVGLEKIDAKLLSSLPELKVISKYGVGTDSLDLMAMQKHKIKLGWTPGINKRSVSELVLCFSLLMLRLVPQANMEVKNGGWNQYKGNQLTDKIFGIVGYGNIGRDLVDLIKPFNCRVLVFDVEKIQDSKNLGVEQVSLEELLALSDIVSLHLPHNNQTNQLIDGAKLKLMKETSILINLARGGIVNEIDLKIALKRNTIAAAAFDVFLQEPPEDEELLNLPNFFATPHIGGISQEAIKEMGMAAIRGLEENSFIDLKSPT